MEMAYYCTQCNAANLIDYHNGEFVGNCYNCGAPIQLQKTETLCINTIIAERYQIRELLEETNINNLYVATDLVTANLVILRVFCWDFSYSISDPEDFLNTVDSVGNIAIPTHVEIVDWGVNEDLMFTVWPCESIESLSKLLKHHASFEPEIALSICRDIAISLEDIYYETGIGHYNLSADVIYLDSQGYTRFSDAGYAAYLFHDEHFRDADFNIFNSHYASPEIILELSFPDIRSDMYSLGCCLYAMVTGKLPFGHRGPKSEYDYKKFSLIAADELRLGDAFCKIFYGLTEVNPQDRFSDWSEVINAMDRYFKDHSASRHSALSGKRRSLTNIYNFDIYSDVDDMLVQKAKSKKRRKKKKVLPSSEIRSRMRSEAPTARLQARYPQSIRKKSKKSDNHTMLIATAAVIIFGLFLFTVFASTFSNREESSVQLNNQEDTKGKANKASSDSNVNKPKVTMANNQDMAEKPLSPEEEFKELTFEIREYTIRKDWDKALAMCALYDGPYSKRVAKLKSEIERKKLGHLQTEVDKATAVLTQKPVKQSESSQEVNLERVIDYIYNGQYQLALSLFPAVENNNDLNLSIEKSSIEDMDAQRLKDLLGRGYKAEVGKTVNLNIEGQNLKGTLKQVSLVNGSLRIEVDQLSRKLEKVYTFGFVDPLDNYKRIIKKDASEQALTRFLYLLSHKLYGEAKKSLSLYRGAFKEPLTKAMQNMNNEEALMSWLELIDFLKLDNDVNDNKFVDGFKFIHLKGGDAWTAKWLMNDFVKKYGASLFFSENESRITLLQSFIAEASKNVNEPLAIVSDDGRAGTMSILKVIRDVETGALVRMLPGEYSGNIIISRKMQIIGATGVNYSGNISLNGDDIHLEDITFKSGYVEVDRAVGNISLNWLHFEDSGIKLRGENSSINIVNCLIRGLNVTNCRQINIKDSLLLESNDPDPQDRYATNGILSGTIKNSVVFSENGFAMKMQERPDSVLELKHCLIYGGRGLVYLSKDKLEIIGLDDFNRNVGRISLTEVVVPSFADSSGGIYKIKDFTPGFFSGENKKTIGIQYNYKSQ